MSPTTQPAKRNNYIDYKITDSNCWYYFYWSKRKIIKQYLRSKSSFKGTKDKDRKDKGKDTILNYCFLILIKLHNLFLS